MCLSFHQSMPNKTETWMTNYQYTPIYHYDPERMRNCCQICFPMKRNCRFQWIKSDCKLVKQHKLLQSKLNQLKKFSFQRHLAIKLSINEVFVNIDDFRAPIKHNYSSFISYWNRTDVDDVLWRAANVSKCLTDVSNTVKYCY